MKFYFYFSWFQGYIFLELYILQILQYFASDHESLLKRSTRMKTFIAKSKCLLGYHQLFLYVMLFDDNSAYVLKSRPHRVHLLPEKYLMDYNLRATKITKEDSLIFFPTSKSLFLSYLSIYSAEINKPVIMKKLHH